MSTSSIIPHPLIKYINILSIYLTKIYETNLIYLLFDKYFYVKLWNFIIVVNRYFFKNKIRVETPRKLITTYNRISKFIIISNNFTYLTPNTSHISGIFIFLLEVFYLNKSWTSNITLSYWLTTAVAISHA